MLNSTPGPWRWEFSRKSKKVALCGGKQRHDLIVLDFVRYGMVGAAPRFRTGSPDMNIMKRCDEFAAECPGREHHANWFQLLKHPDAQLIEAAPDLLSAIQRIIHFATGTCDMDKSTRLKLIAAECTAELSKLGAK